MLVSSCCETYSVGDRKMLSMEKSRDWAWKIIPSGFRSGWVEAIDRFFLGSTPIHKELWKELPFLPQGAVTAAVTYVSFHFISYCCRHHDAADDGHQDEVKRVHEAGAGWLFDLGTAFAAQGTSSSTAAAGQLKNNTKNHKSKTHQNPPSWGFYCKS